MSPQMRVYEEIDEALKASLTEIVGHMARFGGVRLEDAREKELRTRMCRCLASLASGDDAAVIKVASLAASWDAQQPNEVKECAAILTEDLITQGPEVSRAGYKPLGKLD